MTKKISLLDRKRTHELKNAGTMEHLQAKKQQLLELQEADTVQHVSSPQKTIEHSPSKTPHTSHEQDVEEAAAYIAAIHARLRTSNTHRYELSPYHQEKKLIELLEKMVNAKAQIYLEKGLSPEQNQHECQRFVDDTRALLKKSGILLKPLTVSQTQKSR
ncbi:MAG: hypothetical protein EBX40_04065 [Gammaproteobacteria bacterium]|nr:hypothetical protein [Gammaproteobacteria bacterium]